MTPSATLSDPAPRATPTISTGNPWSSLRKPVLLATLGVGLLAGALLFFGGTQLARQQREASGWVEHTLEVLARAATLDADLAMVASEGRGFLVDRSPDSVTRFEVAATKVAADIAALTALTNDNPSQQALIAGLGPLTTGRIDFLRTIIQRIQAGDEAGAQRLVQTQRGRLLMDQIVATIENLRTEERRLLAQRDRAKRSAERWTVIGLIVCGIVAAVSGLLSVVTYLGSRRERAHLSELHRSEQRFRSLFEQSPLLIHLFDAAGTTVATNPAFERALGAGDVGAYDADLLGRVLAGEVIHTPPVLQKIKASNPGSEDTWMEVTGYPVKDSAGQVREAVMLANDVSGRIRAQQQARETQDRLHELNEALQRQAEEFRTLADNIPTLCWMAHADGFIHWFNRRWYEYTGTDPNDQAGWGWSTVHDPDILPQVVERWSQSLATGQPFEMTFPLRGADGLFRPFLTRVVPIRDAEGTITRWFGTNTDITAQRAAEQALERNRDELELLVQARTSELAANEIRLRESEAGFRLLAEHASDMVVRVGADGRLHYASPATLHIVGQTPAELLARDPRELVHPDDLPAFETLQRRLLGGEVEMGTLSHRLLNPKRGEVWVEVGARALRNPVTGAPDGYVAAVRDVTERKQMDETLRQAQRMDAIGQVTAGVAHDFNNLLHAILGSVSMLHEQDGLDADGRECVQIAEQAAQRGAVLTHRLLAFSRKQTLDPVLVRPDEVVKDIEALLARTLGGRMRVELNIEAAIWPVLADGAQLDNCILNLALNARDATPGGGVIRLLIANRDRQEATASGLPAGEYVCFTVQDEGVGMSAGTLARALEPFFTTKPIGKGTGLGLSMVQGFARQSGGDVRIKSTPGQGTEVSLWLPRATAAAAETAPTVPESVAAPGHGRILVVDDEETVRRTVSLSLTRAGFNVVAVESGEAARELIQAGEAFDLLVADQSMPGLSGSELIEEVARLRLDIPAILITGYDRVSDSDRMAGRLNILVKPFERMTLLRQVEALLDSPSTLALSSLRDEALTKSS